MSYGLNRSNVTVTADVITTIDVGSIVSVYASQISLPRHQNPLDPIHISEQYVYMVTENQNALRGNGNELILTARTGDNIRWRIVTTAGTLDYTAVLTRFVGIANATCLSEPEAAFAVTQVMTPNATNPLVPIAAECNDYYYQSTIEDIPPLGHAIIYTWVFALYRRTTLLAYFDWDPLIYVSE